MPVSKRKAFGILGLVFAILVGICLFRTLILYKPPITDYSNFDKEYYVSDKTGPLKRLSEAIRFKTISYSHHNYEAEAMASFVTYVSKGFPLIHSSPIISHEVVNNFSLLYHVEGSNKKLKPYMLMAHMDVVPVEESKWSVDPFSGKIDDSFLWGRGTMDCKHMVMGILEALEFLLAKGYQPHRSFYIAFGHDEEIDGIEGAQYISKLLKSRNVKLEYILDEGSTVVDNFIPGMAVPTAFVGVSEKGLLYLDLTVNQTPGHSSLPSRETAIVILAKAISKLEGDVFPSMFGKGIENEMLEAMAYATSLPLRVVLTNIWLFKPFIISFMSSPVMSAFHRTTTAVTMINGGTKMNVLPGSASAKVNLRIHPAQTISEVLNYVKNVINDERVEISMIASFKPHPVSPIDSFGYEVIKKSITQIYSNACVVPCTLMANTDTKWYLDLTDSIYRFSILRITLNDLKRIHGHDERISVTNYIDLINFYVHLIQSSDKIGKSKHVHTEL